jgi:hypothetical protein
MTDYIGVDEQLIPCACGAEHCIPYLRPGVTVLQFDADSYRAVCLVCQRKGKWSRSPKQAVARWNDGGVYTPNSASDLLAWRMDQGLTQQQVADLLGCFGGMISEWERGTRKPSKKYRDLMKERMGLVV